MLYKKLSKQRQVVYECHVVIYLRVIPSETIQRSVMKNYHPRRNNLGERT